VRIAKLHLQDFQAHEECTVAFGPAITSIVGATDKGKSAILRALRWCCLNDLGGDEFIREGAKEAVATITIADVERDELHTVQRAKGKQNLYVLDGDEYKAFGQNSVPQDIERLLNLSPINFQSQHDAPFWFSETAGEVSRQLNAIVNLSVIDTAMANIAAQVRVVTTTCSVVQERFESAKNELAELESKRGRIEDFAQIVKQHERTKQLTQNRDRLEHLLNTMSQRADQYVFQDGKFKEGTEVVDLGRKAKRLLQQADQLSSLLRSIAETQAKSTPPPSFAAVEAAHEEWTGLQGEVEGFQAIIEDIQNKQVFCEDRKRVLEQAKKNFHTKIKGENCPICQRPLPS
jgi:chromosome segregation ATPase